MVLGKELCFPNNNWLLTFQELALNHPCVCAKLGLPDKNSSKETVSCEEFDTSGVSPLASPMGSKKTSVQILSPRDLSNVSIYEVERCAFHVSSYVTIGNFRVVTSWLELLTAFNQTLVRRTQRKSITFAKVINLCLQIRISLFDPIINVQFLYRLSHLLDGCSLE